MPNEPVSLRQFADANPTTTGYRSWCDKLPEDIQRQILDTTDVSSQQIVAWLRSLGWEDATYSKVDNFRRTRGRRRNDQS